jgi:hypothetical protein
LEDEVEEVNGFEELGKLKELILVYETLSVDPPQIREFSLNERTGNRRVWRKRGTRLRREVLLLFVLLMIFFWEVSGSSAPKALPRAALEPQHATSLTMRAGRVKDPWLNPAYSG